MAAHIQNFPHIRLFLNGWQKEASNEGSRIPISVPPTLVFEHGVPKMVLLPEEELSDFLTSVGGAAGTSSFEAEFEQAQHRYIEDREYLHYHHKNSDDNSHSHGHGGGGGGGGGDDSGGSAGADPQLVPEPHIITARRAPRDISQPMLLAAMSNPAMAPTTSDPEAVVAYFVGITDAGGNSGESRVDVRYMNREQLKRFFSKRELPDREGIQVELAADSGGHNSKQSAIMADCRVRDRIDEVMTKEASKQDARWHRHDEAILTARQQWEEEEREIRERSNIGKSKDENHNSNINSRLNSAAQSAGNSPSQLSLSQPPHPLQQFSLPPHRVSFAQGGGGAGSETPQSPSLLSGRSSPRSKQRSSRSFNTNANHPRLSPVRDERMQLTGFLQRFEYTPSHHSEIVTMRWTRSYCDFERVRNSVLLEDRSRRAAERAATVDAPPTLVRRYSVTERLKTLMRQQADLLADRFNAALHQQGRSFVLTQATLLFRMGFHGHVYFLWCSKMQLEKHHHGHPAGGAHPQVDWAALVRRPPQPIPQLTQQQQRQEASAAAAATAAEDNNNDSVSASASGMDTHRNSSSDVLSVGGDSSVASSSPTRQHPLHHRGAEQPTQVRYHAFGRKFLDIGQGMLDREQMLRQRGLSRELGDLEEPIRADVSDDSDEEDGGGAGSRRRSASRGGGGAGAQRGRVGAGGTSGGGASADDSANGGVRAGTGLMPLYSEHRIAVTQAQRHLGRALPVPTCLLTNIQRRDRTQTAEVLRASRSLRANRDEMLEILRKADHSLHGKFERPKVKNAACMGKPQSRRHNSSSNMHHHDDDDGEDDLDIHDDHHRGRSPSPPASSSFIKQDKRAGTVEAKLTRLLGRRGRQAALMMPELIAQLEREQAAGGREALARMEAEEREQERAERERQVQLEFEQATALNVQQDGNDNFGDDLESLDGGGSTKQQQQDDDGDDAQRKQHQQQQQLQSRPRMALMRTLLSSWKSWILVYFKRMQDYFARSIAATAAAEADSHNSLHDVSSIRDGATANATASNDNVSVCSNVSSKQPAPPLPIAASVAFELLELHYRQYRLVARQQQQQQDAPDQQSNTTTGTPYASPPRGRQACVEFWSERFLAAGATPCSAEEAAQIDRRAGQHLHIDDSALHNCRVIEADDVFCFSTPSTEVAQAVCKMIHDSFTV